ncbi:MAG: hypothetical protein WAQ33_16705 [Gaiellaceae bacterium]
MLADEVDDKPALARALAAAGVLAAWQSDVEAAHASLDRAIDLWQQLDEPLEEAVAHEALSWAHFTTGDEAKAQREADRALELQLALGDPMLINRARFYVCLVLVSRHELDAAERMANEALALGEEQGDAWAQHFAFHYLGDCALIRGDDRTSEQWYRRSLAAAVAARDHVESIFELQGVAMASAVRAADRALQLAGAADAELAALAIDISGVTFWIELLEEKLKRAVDRLGPEAAAAARQRGARHGFDRLVEEELNSSDDDA